MSITRAKLSEAVFFLGQLKSSMFEYPQFNYYLSAFISSARSVLWIMRSEFEGVDGWEEWYQSKKPDSEEKHFLKKINDIRVRTEKISPIRTYFQISLMIPKETATPELEQELRKLQRTGETFSVVVSKPEKGEVIETEISKEKIHFQGKLEEVYHVIGDFPDEDVLNICARYLEILESMVDECEEVSQAQGI